MHSAHTTKNNIYSNTQHIHIIIICKLSCPATTSLLQSWCFRKLKACSCEPRVATIVEDFCSQNTGALPLTCVIWGRCGGRIWDMRSRKPQKSHRFLSKNKLKWFIVKISRKSGTNSNNPGNLERKTLWPWNAMDENHGFPRVAPAFFVPWFPLISISDVTRHTIPRAAL